MVLKHKPKALVCFILTVLFLSAAGVFIYGFLNPLSHEYYIFDQISECEQLIAVNQTDVKTDRYNDASGDKDAKGLSYDEFFGMNFKSNELEYEIFAYEFEDNNAALKYFVSVTGKTSYEKKLPLDSEDENKLFSASRGMAQYRIVITHQNKAYKIISSNKYEDEINELLSNTFSIKIS